MNEQTLSSPPAPRDIQSYRFIRELQSLPFIDAIYLYGSRARGTHRERSDIDLAIFCPRADRRQWQHVLSIIDDADTLLEIDCIRIDGDPSDPALMRNIEQDKKVIYERK